MNYFSIEHENEAFDDGDTYRCVDVFYLGTE